MAVGYARTNSTGRRTDAVCTVGGMRTVVLVHGLWHGSWCWSPVATRLAASGVPSVAVDLDGHGLKSAATAGVTATTAAASLVEQLRRIGGG